MPPPLSLSTCWNSRRHTDGYKMLEEIAGLGFKRVELSHGIQISLVEGIQAAIKDRVIEVHSLHNFCPLPPVARGAAPNLYRPTAPDAKERELWFRHTLKTLDFAVEMGAKRIVLHLGDVHFSWRDPVETLEHYIKDIPYAQLEHDQDYITLLGKTIERLREKSAAALPVLYNSLERLIPYVQERGLLLGFENREDLRELPLDESFPQLLDDFMPTGAVGYWHDSGHAQLKANLGIIDIEEHLSLNGPRMIGCHLHDVVDDRDHRPPGTGMVDFALLAPYLDPEKVVVIMELSPHTEAQDILTSRTHLESIFKSQEPENSPFTD